MNIAKLLISVIVGVLPVGTPTYIALEGKNNAVSEAIKEVIPIYSMDYKYPKLRQICACESGDGVTPRHSVGGKVLISTTSDYGSCQINQVHLEHSKKLGLDITKEADNITYAIMLYEQSGTQPWLASKKCWNKDLRV